MVRKPTPLRPRKKRSGSATQNLFSLQEDKRFQAFRTLCMDALNFSGWRTQEKKKPLPQPLRRKDGLHALFEDFRRRWKGLWAVKRASRIRRTALSRRILRPFIIIFPVQLKYAQDGLLRQLFLKNPALCEEPSDRNPSLKKQNAPDSP